MSRSREGRALRIGVPYRPSGIDPHVNSSELAYRIFANVFDPLVWRTKTGAYVPGLAERWEIASDGLSYGFQLRRGVSFHDGTPLTASAVGKSFDRIADPATRSQAARDMLGPYARCDIVGEHELVVRLDEPFAPFLDAVSQAWLAPASPAAIADLGPRFAQQPVGTGPFRVGREGSSDDLALVANPAYRWTPPHLPRQSPPSIGRVDFVFLPDAGARDAALREGAIQIFYEYPTTELTRIAADPDLVVRIDAIPGAPVGLMLNTSRLPTSDIAVRRALACALDVPELVRRVFGERVRVATAPLASTTWVVEAQRPADDRVDVARARALLDQAGWRSSVDGVRTKDGGRLSLVFCALRHASYPAIGAEVARQLRPLGCDVDVRVLEIGEWLAAGNAGLHHLIPVGKFACEPDVLETLYHSRHVGSGYAWSHCRDVRLDGVLAEALRSLDADRRRELFLAAQRRITELALVIPIHENLCVTVLRTNVHGFDADLRSYPLLHGVSLTAPMAVAS